MNGAMDNNTKKTVIVTGGASGIGLAMTRHFASQGHNVVVLDVSPAAREAVSQVASEIPGPHAGGAVAFKRCDVSSWQHQATAFAEVYRDLGRIDVVMANAGISEQGPSSMARVEEDGPVEPRLAVLQVDLVGVVYSVKLAIHYMNKNEIAGASRGTIICTASNAGLYPFPVAPLYAAAKAGVIGLVRSTAPVLERLRIQINALAPAVLETNIVPDKELFRHMVVTPMATLTRGVAQLIADPSLNGEVAEVHGDCVTLRPPHGFVDEDSQRNIETFGRLGYA